MLRSCGEDRFMVRTRRRNTPWERKVNLPPKTGLVLELARPHGILPLQQSLRAMICKDLYLYRCFSPECDYYLPF